jgi:hypothetical protein
MIQRVQSVYLLLVTVVMSFLIVSPYAKMMDADNQTLVFKSYAIVIEANDGEPETYKNTVAVITLVLLTSLISFICIFLYNRRLVQIRICIINTILLIVLLVVMFLYYKITRDNLNPLHPSFEISAIFPMISVALTIMAYRAIRHDDMLVNSFERLR